MADAQALFDWRNDAATRAASHQTGELVYTEHCAWLEKTLSNPLRHLYIALVNGDAVGTFRVDVGEMGDAELSWTVAPQARGNGYGKLMVKTAADRYPGRLKAEIKAGNAASIRIAEAAGFALESERDGCLYYARHQ